MNTVTNGNIELNQISLLNSLTGKKDPLKTAEPNIISWYCCGPTVYDAAHMGHARSYISFDIIRRILSDYFNYNIIYVMNITDVDDKIIKKARMDHLWQEFSQNISKNTLKESLKEAISHFKLVVERTADPALAQIRSIRLNSTIDFHSNLDNINLEPSQLLPEYVKDVLSDYLDFQNGAKITEHEIFLKLTKHYEREFFKDMDALLVKRPDLTPRVTEYIPQIVEFIQKIISNGYGYVSNDSVYFDVSKFSSDRVYRKLSVETEEDSAALETGEGELSNKIKSEKKCSKDFVLWKASKSGEPFWDSPWGKGRPGWHIECSVMGSDLLGNGMDIHSGGIDLKFPHHENEMAQSEAALCIPSWVNMFLHTGHLTIEGCKMSKSLKNFISIRDALKDYTARQIRIAFLTHSWHGPLDFSKSMMQEATRLDAFFEEYFCNVSSVIRSSQLISNENVDVFLSEENELKKILLETQKHIHQSLCDNIDTPSVMKSLRSLSQSALRYVDTQSTSGNLVIGILRFVSNYIHKMLSIFGCTYDSYVGSLQGSSLSTEAIEVQSQRMWQLAKVVSDFRRNVRQKAMESKDSYLLHMCDRLRDFDLTECGIKIEDSADGRETAIKVMDPIILIKQRQEILELANQKEIAARQKKEEQKKIQMERERLLKIPPKELFLLETDKYSKFNDEGIPTHDSNNVEISKSQMSKLKKLQQQHADKYQKHLSKQSKNECE